MMPPTPLVGAPKPTNTRSVNVPFQCLNLPVPPAMTPSPPPATTEVAPRSVCCGGFKRGSMKAPQHTDLGATSVVAGGGDGVIAGGTGKFKHWKGTFTDRVFVGFGAPTSGVGGIIY